MQYVLMFSHYVISGKNDGIVLSHLIAWKNDPYRGEPRALR